MFKKIEKTEKNKISTLWFDLGELGAFNKDHAFDKWQDHGLGILRTIMHNAGIQSDVITLKDQSDWNNINHLVKDYNVLLMNVRSYNFPLAKKVAEIFKSENNESKVIVGGIHASVSLSEMTETSHFDIICQGPGENLINDLVTQPNKFSRVVDARSYKTTNQETIIDRKLWPKSKDKIINVKNFWPLEVDCGWGPPPVATVITSRVCPWKCSFCNENSYIENMKRRDVKSVISELLMLDNQYNVGSVVIHDSMFFQNPHWIKEWIHHYSLKTKRWPYWATARSDTIRAWPELFENAIYESNWSVVSVGFESGSDRVLRILNKECTEDDNNYAIELLNSIADKNIAKGLNPPKFWANIMLAVPGETISDAIRTIRMVKRMRYAIPSVSLFSPYPGSALGYQLIAENKSLMSKENYHRYPNQQKISGIDYHFYKELLLGKYDDQVNIGLTKLERENTIIYDTQLFS